MLAYPAQVEVTVRDSVSRTSLCSPCIDTHIPTVWPTGLAGDRCRSTATWEHPRARRDLFLLTGSCFQPAQFSQNLSLSLWARARNWEGPSRHLAGSWFPTVRRNRTQAILQREGFYRPSTPASREAIPSHISSVCKCDWINISSPSLSPNFWRPSLHPHPLWIWRVTLPRNQKTKVANRMVTRKNAAGLNNERLEGILQSNMIVCFCLP